MSDVFSSNQLSEKELKRSYWFLTHLTDFKQIGVWLLIGVNALFGLIVLGTLLNYYALQYTSQRAVYDGYTTLTTKNPGVVAKAQDLQIMRSGAIPNGAFYDLYTEVGNSNTSWRAEFSYAFSINGGETRTQKGFIMPGESKFFVLLSQEGSAPSNVTLVIKDLMWHRVSKKDAAYLSERTNFSVSDFTFTSSLESNVSSSIPIGRAKFTLKNNSGFSYWAIGLPIVLVDGNTVVAVNYLGIENVLPNETRQLEARWFQSIPLVTAGQIKPSVNVFDTTVFRPVQGERSPEPRNDNGSF